MGIHKFYTVFDNSPVERSKCHCAVFAHLNLAACRDFKSVWWQFEPREYRSVYEPHGEDVMSWRQDPIPIKYSLEPNLIFTMEGTGIARLVAGRNGIKAGEELSWTAFNLESFPVDAQGCPDLSPLVREQNEKLRKYAEAKPRLSKRRKLKDLAVLPEDGSFSTYTEMEYCLEHDEETGGVSIGYIERGPVHYVESEVGSEGSENECDEE